MAHRRRHAGLARLFSSSYQPRHHRRRSNRHHARHNPPEFAAILSHPADVITPGLVATGAAIGVVTVGNYVSNTFLTSLTGTFTGVTGILARAGVRGAVAYVGDMLVNGSKYRDAYRTGVIMGIVGSAVLDFMGKQFTLGAGDTAQTPMTVLGLAGAGAYMRTGVAGTGAYLHNVAPRRLAGVGNRGPAATAMARLYSAV